MLMCALLLVVPGVKGTAQDIARVRTAYTPRTISRSTDDSSVVRHSRSAARIVAGFFAGLTTGVGALAIGDCLRFDFEDGPGCRLDAGVTTFALGYFAGAVWGSAAIGGGKCSLPMRFARALAGGVAGAFVSVFVGRMATLYDSDSPGGILIVIAGAPVIGASWALRRCD